MSSGTLLNWIVFGCVVAGLLTLDLVVSARRGDQSVRAAFVWSGVWIVISAAFGGWIAARLGADAAFTYYTAYLLEKSLSVDNLLMFGLVFVQTGVSPKLRRKALLWGVPGALVMRAALIAPLSEFHIILDTRKAESRMTSTDLWDLASELKRLGAAFPGKTAVELG